MSDKLSDERDSIEYAIQVLRQVEAGDGTFVGQCADAIEGLEALLAASPAPAIPAVDPVAIIEQCAIRAATHSQYPVETDFDHGYAKARRDAAHSIRALKAAPAISESEDARDAARYRWLRDKHDGDGPAAAVRCLTGPFFNAAIHGERLDATIDAARKGEKS